MERFQQDFSFSDDFLRVTCKIVKKLFCFYLNRAGYSLGDVANNSNCNLFRHERGAKWNDCFYLIRKKIVQGGREFSISLPSPSDHSMRQSTCN